VLSISATLAFIHLVMIWEIAAVSKEAMSSGIMMLSYQEKMMEAPFKVIDNLIHTGHPPFYLISNLSCIGYHHN